MDMDVDVTKIEYIEYGCGCGWHIQNHYQYSKKTGYRCLVVNSWNGLDQKVVDSESLNAFKSNLDIMTLSRII